MDRVLTVILTVFLMIVSGAQIVSADRADASEHSTIIDTDGYEGNLLITDSGTAVEVWIDSIDGVGGDSAHAIDVYIATSDEYFDHFCGGQDNQFAEEFNPMYTKEKLQISELPFYFTYTPISDDSYYLLIDNCDNQKESDWGHEESESTTQLLVTYAIDDQTDELAEGVATGILAVLGGSALFCCGVPLLLVILIIVIKRKKSGSQIIVQSPSGE